MVYSIVVSSLQKFEWKHRFIGILTNGEKLLEAKAFDESFMAKGLSLNFACNVKQILGSRKILLIVKEAENAAGITA